MSESEYVARLVKGMKSPTDKRFCAVLMSKLNVLIEQVLETPHTHTQGACFKSQVTPTMQTKLSNRNYSKVITTDKKKIKKILSLKLCIHLPTQVPDTLYPVKG